MQRPDDATRGLSLPMENGEHLYGALGRSKGPISANHPAGKEGVLRKLFAEVSPQKPFGPFWKWIRCQRVE